MRINRVHITALFIIALVAGGQRMFIGDWIVLVIGSIWMLYHMAGRRRMEIPLSTFRLAVVFLLLAGVSYSPELNFRIESVGLLYAIFIVLLFCTTPSFHSRQEWKRIFQWAFRVAVLTAPLLERNGKFCGFLVNANFVSLITLLSLVLEWDGKGTDERGKVSAWKILYSLVCLSLLVHIRSRSAFLSVIVVAGITLFRRTGTAARILTTVTGVCLAVAGIYFLKQADVFAFKRLLIYQNTMEFVRTSPWIGWGIGGLASGAGTYAIVYDPALPFRTLNQAHLAHSVLLSSLTAFGMIGTIVLVAELLIFMARGRLRISSWIGYALLILAVHLVANISLLCRVVIIFLVVMLAEFSRGRVGRSTIAVTFFIKIMIPIVLVCSFLMLTPTVWDFYDWPGKGSIVRLFPETDENILTRRALFLGEERRLPEAMAEAEHARRLSRQTLSPALTLALVSFRAGDTARSIRTLKSVARANILLYEPIYREALTWRVVGEQELAREKIGLILILEPWFPAAWRLRAELSDQPVLSSYFKLRGEYSYLLLKGFQNQYGIQSLKWDRFVSE